MSTTNAAKHSPQATKIGIKRAADASSSRPEKKARKSSSRISNLTEEASKIPDVPVKAVQKKQTTSKKSPPSTSTPTPSLAHDNQAPHSTGDIDDAGPPPEDRPVEPHVTNARLITPGRTQSVAYTTNASDESASKNGIPRPTDTTGTLLDTACAHLIKVDPRLKPIIAKHCCEMFTPEGLAEEVDTFRSLASSIMGQQISGAAAKTVRNRFVALFNEESIEVPSFPTPAQVAATDILRLKSAGLSLRKAEYIHGLAQKFASGELTNDMLMNGSDEEVMEKLIAVRGLGKWSVEMFACHELKRMDILSTGDLGVQRGMAQFFGKDVQRLKAKGGGKWKYMSEQDMLDKSAPFAPYRSLFMWYMWQVADVNVEVMQSTS